jgi:hypothetical protein
VNACTVGPSEEDVKDFFTDSVSLQPFGPSGFGLQVLLLNTLDGRCRQVAHQRSSEALEAAG